jgi:hypothetical protein
MLCIGVATVPLAVAVVLKPDLGSAFAARVIRAALCPASRWANIYVTTGAVARSRSVWYGRRPQAACASFGCGPASANRYQYGAGRRGIGPAPGPGRPWRCGPASSCRVRNQHRRLRAALPVMSPDPASPRPRPARKTRTASFTATSARPDRRRRMPSRPGRRVRARGQADPGPALARADRHSVPPRQARRPDRHAAGTSPAHHHTPPRRGRSGAVTSPVRAVR